MIQIRADSDQAEVSGSPQELQSVRNAILKLINSTERTLALSAETSIDPRPYPRRLKQLSVTRGVGPSKVTITSDDSLVVTGADDNLARFASWFNFALDASPGEHGHYGYIEGTEFIARDSVEVVVEVSR